MGTYLVTGIVQKMRIQKREMESSQIQLEDVIQSLKKELDIDHYILSESENDIFWNIKHEMLEGNFAEFLETQFKIYQDNLDEDMQQTITNVKEAQTGENIIKLAEERRHSHFQIVDYVYEALQVRRLHGFPAHITVKYNLLAFFIDGKIIIECYGNILHYFERNIRFQEKKYPIVSCLKTMITS